MQDWILESTRSRRWIRPTQCLSSPDSPQNLSRKVLDFKLTWVCLDSTFWGENLSCFWIPLPESMSFSPHRHLYSQKREKEEYLVLHWAFSSWAPLVPKGEWKSIFSSPHGCLYSLKGERKVVSLPHWAFPSWYLYSPRGEWKSISFPPFSPHGHLYSIWREWKTISLPPTPSFPLTGPFILPRGMEEPVSSSLPPGLFSSWVPLFS